MTSLQLTLVATSTLLSLAGCSGVVDSSAGTDAIAPTDAFPADGASTKFDAGSEPVDCSGISANPDYELCESDATMCAGVFTDGSNCNAFCAAAGLVCTARYGGESGCNKETANVLSCSENSGHQSDWCECGEAGSDPNVDADAGVNTGLEYEIEFHHTTTASSDGGKSLVLCPGQTMNFDSCAVGDVNIPRHGDDNGRETYWNQFQEPVGDIVCLKNGATYKYRADQTILFGQCN